MRTIFITIILLALAVCASAADIALTWDANTETDLAGYRVYQGTGSNPATFTKIQETVATTATIKGLDNTAHSFAVTAYNTAGMESAYSNVVTIPAVPAIPGGLKWTLTLSVTGGQ